MGQTELLNLPVLVLKAIYRHLCGSTFCLVRIGVSDKALGVVPLGFVEDRLLENTHTYECMHTAQHGASTFGW